MAANKKASGVAKAFIKIIYLDDKYFLLQESA
jgi:hypothetical protein